MEWKFVPLVLGVFWFFAAPVASAQTVDVVAKIPGNGSHFGPLLFTEDGRIFCAATAGGAHKEGLLFVVDKSGATRTLFEFDHKTGGAYPFGPLVATPDGGIMGATIQGGPGGGGTIYKWGPDENMHTLATFGPPGPRNPYGGLVASRTRPGIYYGTTYSGPVTTPVGGALFEMTDEGKIRYLTTDLSMPFGPIYVDRGEQIYVTTKSGGHVSLGVSGIATVGAVWQLGLNGKPRKVANLKFGGYGGVDDFCALGMDVRNAMRQRLHFRRDEQEIVFLDQEGGRFSEGCLFSVPIGGALKDLRDFKKTDALGGPINEIVLADDGTIYGVMGATQIYGNDPHRVTTTPLSGAICQILENGDVKVIWKFDKEGPRAMLTWHEGAIYGMAPWAIYRLNLPAAAKAP